MEKNLHYPIIYTRSMRFLYLALFNNTAFKVSIVYIKISILCWNIAYGCLGKDIYVYNIYILLYSIIQFDWLFSKGWTLRVFQNKLNLIKCLSKENLLPIKSWSKHQVLQKYLYEIRWSAVSSFINYHTKLTYRGICYNFKNLGALTDNCPTFKISSAGV